MSSNSIFLYCIALTLLMLGISLHAFHIQQRPQSFVHHIFSKRKQYPDHIFQPWLIRNAYITLGLAKPEFAHQKPLYIGMIADRTGSIVNILQSAFLQIIPVHFKYQTVIYTMLFHV